MNGNDRRPARRRQRRQEQQQYQKQQQQQYRQQYQQQYQQQRYGQPALPGLPAPPQNLDQLKQLFSQYGPLLSAENRSFISELIARLEAGGDPAGLAALAERMQQAARRQGGQ